MLVIYDRVRSCRCVARSKRISLFHILFAFNVALKVLGPIDQNDVLFVRAIEF